jgi:itaconyl-CoA hydratase
VTLGDPLFHGDTLSAETEVLEKRESESREGLGIVTVETTGFKQTGDQVLSFERSIVIPLRNEYHD